MIVLAPILLLAALWDIMRREVPNALIICGVLVALGINFQVSPQAFALSIAGGAIGLLALLPLYARGLIGAGDCKLLAMIGCIVGFPHIIIALIIGMGIGTCALTCVMSLTYGKRMTHIPYAPFLVFGALVSMAFGQSILDAWLESVERLL